MEGLAESDAQSGILPMSSVPELAMAGAGDGSSGQERSVLRGLNSKDVPVYT